MSFTEIMFKENQGKKEIHGKIYFKYDKIPYYKVLEEDKEMIHLAVYNRIKTTENEYKVSLKIPEDQRFQFFSKRNIFKLENYFINTDLITFIKEERLNPSKVRLTIFFEGYSMYLIINTTFGRWESWKNVRL